MAASWILTILGATSVFSAAPDIDIEARVEPSEILVGEPIRYVITLTRPARLRAVLPAVRGNTGRLEVEGYRATLDTLPDGRVRETHALSLTAWTPGDDTLPPQRVEIRADAQAGGDSAATVLYTPPTAVAVRATASQEVREKEGLADIRDAERLPGSFPWGLPLLIAALAALWYFLRRRKRRPRPAATAPQARAATAEETVLARLRELEASGIPSRPFAFALSEILRSYLADRFAMDALEATTEELLERARSLPLTGERKEWLREFCESLDRAKFADATLAPADCARLLREARDFVAESKPAVMPDVAPADKPVAANSDPDVARPA